MIREKAFSGDNPTFVQVNESQTGMKQKLQTDFFIENFMHNASTVVKINELSGVAIFY